ncbi:MAG: DUF4976 domain-containing protein [Nitrospiraceae bacterium]|nr:MAG: DUF4976 domain-containing protein [Nitrospiraceae bacterium]
MGDVFYRWDGFKYYASLSEYLPSVALITIIWSFVAALTSLLIWISFSIVRSLFSYKKWDISLDHWLLFTSLLALLLAVFWFSKRFILHTSPQLLNQVLMLGILPVSIALTWLLRSNATRWIRMIQEQIAPLLYLFTLCFAISIFLVIYTIYVKKSDLTAPQSLSQSSQSNTDRPNILLVTFDALTARDMSAYGYYRPTTPFISEWAKTASLFTRHQAASNYTRSTVSSLMTGKRVWTHQIYHSDQRSKPLNIATENIAKILKENGYYNIGIITTLEASTGDLDAHFDVRPPWNMFMMPESLSELINSLLFNVFGHKFLLYDWVIKEDFIAARILNKFSIDSSSTSKRPQLAFNKFIEVLDGGIPEPYFAWIHLFPPHWPYLPPEQYKGLFDPSPELRTAKSQKKLLDSLDNYIATEKTMPQINILRARYDEFIRYCDDQFRDFISKLEAKNKLINSVIILSSDHGESFDHKYINHGGPDLFESMTNIPLIIKEAGQTKGQILDELVDQTDIPASILELAKIDVPDWIEGRSIVPLLRYNKIPPKPIYSMNFESNEGHGHRISSGTVAVWSRDYKLIHYLEDNLNLLFNLAIDPDELNNIYDKEMEEGQNLLKLIHDGLNKANEKTSKRD